MTGDYFGMCNASYYLNNGIVNRNHTGEMHVIYMSKWCKGNTKGGGIRKLLEKNVPSVFPHNSDKWFKTELVQFALLFVKFIYYSS